MTTTTLPTLPPLSPEGARSPVSFSEGPPLAVNELEGFAQGVLAADRNPLLVYLGRLGPGSRRTMRAALDGIAGRLTRGRLAGQTFPWWQLRYQHTVAIRTDLGGRYAPATANKCLAALRGVLRESWRLGWMTAEDLARATDLDPIRGQSLQRGRALSEAELRALFDDCSREGSVRGLRDAALLAILYGAGLRRAEAVALDLADYDEAGDRVTVRRGKGQSARRAHLASGVQAVLTGWLDARGRHSGPLLTPVAKGGHVVRHRLSDHATLLILQHRATSARVRILTPHDLRRTFVSNLLAAGVDISIVQQLVGHASVQTTAGYDRRSEEVRSQSVRSVVLPWHA